MIRARFERYPPKPYKRYGAFGFGVIISDDKFKGISIVFGYWHFIVGNLKPKEDGAIPCLNPDSPPAVRC